VGDPNLYSNNNFSIIWLKRKVKKIKLLIIQREVRDSYVTRGREDVIHGLNSPLIFICKVVIFCLDQEKTNTSYFLMDGT